MIRNIVFDMGMVLLEYDPVSYTHLIEIFHESRTFLPCSFSDPLTETAVIGRTPSRAGFPFQRGGEQRNRLPDTFHLPYIIL